MCTRVRIQAFFSHSIVHFLFSVDLISSVISAMAHDSLDFEPSFFEGLRARSSKLFAVMTGTILTVNPTFTIHDWEKADPILQKCVEGTKVHKGCMYYGFIKNNDKVECREAWTDAASLKEHIEGENGIGSIMGALVEPDVATLNSIYVTGPPGEELNKAVRVFEAFGAIGYELFSGFDNIKGYTGDELHPNALLTVHPTFTIVDFEKAKPLLEQCTGGTRVQSGCIYYGFVKNGTTVKCREAWADAAALEEHISGPKGIGSIMGPLLEPDVAKLDSIFVAGPAEELERAVKIFEASGCEGYESFSGFSRFSL